MSQSLAAFTLRRTAGAVAVCVAVTALTFLTLHGLAPEFFDDTRPLPLEMVHYLKRVFLHADLGVSTFRPFQPVLDMLGESIPADLSMLVGSMVVGLLAGSAGGALCVRHPGSLLSRLLQVAAAVLLCAPVYVTGMMVILLFRPGGWAAHADRTRHGEQVRRADPRSRRVAARAVRALADRRRTAGRPVPADGAGHAAGGDGRRFRPHGAGEGAEPAAGDRPPRAARGAAGDALAGRRLHAAAARQRRARRGGVRHHPASTGSSRGRSRTGTSRCCRGSSSSAPCSSWWRTRWSTWRSPRSTRACGPEHAHVRAGPADQTVEMYVIFDLDDTLVHSDAVREAFVVVAGEHEIALDVLADVLDTLPGRPALEIFAALGLRRQATARFLE